MKLAEVLDQLEALGNTPLESGAMSGPNGRYCAAAHMLRIIGAFPDDDSTTEGYEIFTYCFGFNADNVWSIADNLEDRTAAASARALRTHLADRLDRPVQVSAEGSLHGV